MRVLFGHCLFGRLTGGKGRYFIEGSLSIGIFTEMRMESFDE